MRTGILPQTSFPWEYSLAEDPRVSASTPPLPSSGDTSAPLSELAFQARVAFDEALTALARLSGSEIAAVLSDGPMERLLATIAPLRHQDTRPGELVYDYLLRHRAGLTLLAQVRRAIMVRYSLEGSVEGSRVYISPDERQWFDDSYYKFNSCK